MEGMSLNDGLVKLIQVLNLNSSKLRADPEQIFSIHESWIFVAERSKYFILPKFTSLKGEDMLTQATRVSFSMDGQWCKILSSNSSVTNLLLEKLRYLKFFNSSKLEFLMKKLPHETDKFLKSPQLTTVNPFACLQLLIDNSLNCFDFGITNSN